MKQKIKSILFDLFLFAVLVCLVLVFHGAFIAGPQRVKEREEKLYMEAYSEKYKVRNLEFVTDFYFDETYYIVKDSDHLYWFNKELTKTDSAPLIGLDKAYEKAKELGFDQKNINYGVYKGEIIFSLESKEKIVFLNVDTLDIEFEFGG